MEKKIRFTIVLLLLVAVVWAISLNSAKSKETLIYNESLNQTALIVDGNEFTLEDLAFYVAYEEKTVQEQAIVYNPSNPNQYWNLHIDGTFIKISAKQAVLDMAAHDEIFYQMAEENGIELNAEEEEYYENEANDFCMDLEEGQWEALGVTEENIRETMYRIAIANKYQNILAAENEVAYETYNFENEAYQEMCAEHEIITKEAVWDRIDFGNITLDNK